MVAFGQMPEDVLDHDDGGIDDDAEVDRAHRQQVRRFAAQHQHDHGKQQRKGDRGGDDQRAAQVAQEQPLDQEDEADAHDHVVQHGVGGDVHQRAAIVDALDVHARRQDVAVVDLVDFGQHAAQGRHGLRAAPHQHDALHDVVVVVLTGDAEPRLVAHRDVGHVGDQNRGPVADREHGVADVVHRPDLADTAHDRRLRADVHGIGADIDVGVVQSVQHLLERKPVGQQPVEIDGDVVGLGLAAPAGDVDDAGDRLQAPLQDPVLQRLEVGDGVARRADDTVAEDLADRAGGRQGGLRAVGHRAELRQPIDHHLRGLLVRHVVGELDLHVAQSEQRDRADGLDIGEAGHLDLDRDGDVALDLLGGLAGILRDDVDQRRHRIGIGLDVQPRVGEQSGDGQHHAQDDDEDSLLEGGGDEGLHGQPICWRDAPGGAPGRQSRLAARSMKSVPLVTTFSPRARPFLTSTMPFAVAPTSIARDATDLSCGLATHTRALAPS